MIALQLAISYRHDQNATDYFLFCSMVTRIGSTVQFRGEFPVGYVVKVREQIPGSSLWPYVLWL